MARKGPNLVWAVTVDTGNQREPDETVFQTTDREEAVERLIEEIDKRFTKYGTGRAELSVRALIERERLT